MHIRKEFFRFVIPSMLAFALSGIYAIADGFFVGNAMGDDALAAVNIAYPLTAFLQAVGTGIGMGGAIEYAINAGNQNENRGRQYMGMAILLLGGFSFSLPPCSCSPVLRSWVCSARPARYWSTAASTCALSAMGRYSRSRELAWFLSSATWAERSRPWRPW